MKIYCILHKFQDYNINYVFFFKEIESYSETGYLNWVGYNRVTH